MIDLRYPVAVHIGGLYGRRESSKNLTTDWLRCWGGGENPQNSVGVRVWLGRVLRGCACCCWGGGEVPLGAHTRIQWMSLHWLFWLQVISRGTTFEVLLLNCHRLLTRRALRPVAMAVKLFCVEGIRTESSL